jgi:RNA polymerase sigma factor (sigma-70 family)
LAETDWSSLADNLLRFAISLTGTRDQAEDLVQQTIATLLAKRPQSADHRGLARTTLTRLWLSRQRAHRRLLARLRRIATIRTRPAEPSDPAEITEQAGIARQAIDALPPRQRAVLLLRVVEGLPYEVIAQTLACDVQAVRANLHLARARVRAHLEGHQ